MMVFVESDALPKELSRTDFEKLNTMDACRHSLFGS